MPEVSNELAAARLLRKDAERYRWLRQQNWNDSVLAVVCNPKEAVKLGHDCPSLDRLDASVDAAMIWQAWLASEERIPETTVDTGSHGE